LKSRTRQARGRTAAALP
jgi:hypothetical protein